MRDAFPVIRLAGNAAHGSAFAAVMCDLRAMHREAFSVMHASLW
jgi:hypothetical protein